MKLVYRGAKEIGGAVGISWKEIGFYVRELGLPAFKICNRGSWLALEDDLARWLRNQRDIAIQREKYS